MGKSPTLRAVGGSTIGGSISVCLGVAIAVGGGLGIARRAHGEEERGGLRESEEAEEGLEAKLKVKMKVKMKSNGRRRPLYKNNPDHGDDSTLLLCAGFIVLRWLTVGKRT